MLECWPLVFILTVNDGDAAHRGLIHTPQELMLQ